MVSGQPLAGHRVVDLTRFVSGAFATMTLASLGADVIKIEGLPHGDPYRAQGTSFVDGRSSLFLGLNTGKRSVALDLRAAEGRSLVDRLLSEADVLVENGRPGALVGTGLDYESVHRRHPGVVYGSISGYGPVGPDAGSGGFDVILQAESGIMSVTGSEESGPVKVGVPLLDVGAGVSCVAGILAALVERQRSGEGRHVSSSLLEFAMAGFVGSVTSFLQGGDAPGLLGSHSPTFSPYGAFRCRDDHLVIAGSGAERLWGILCEVLDLVHLVTDPRFATNADRVRHRDELTSQLESVLVTQPAAVWADRLRRVGVPVGSVRTLGDVLANPQVAALDLIRAERVQDTCYSTVGPPVQIDGPLPYPRPAPDLGEHTREVLESLGLSADQIRRLHDDGQVLVA